MQTFVPYPDVTLSAACLDRQRLGKQRVEVLQILNALANGGGWEHHPAVQMWRGHERALAWYGIGICREWRSRGYQDTCAVKIADLVCENDWPAERGWPGWWGDARVHASHRSNLLRKDLKHYSQFEWTEPDDLPYFWPSSESQGALA